MVEDPGGAVQEEGKESADDDCGQPTPTGKCREQTIYCQNMTARRPAPQSPPHHPFTLGLVLFPGCMPAGLFAVSDWVRACNLRVRQVRVTVKWVAADLAPVPTHRGPSLAPDDTLVAAPLDACLLPGLWLTAADDMDAALPALRSTTDALSRLPRATQLWSYCAGVALAAATGRLDQQSATATWWLQPALATRFPRVFWNSAADVASSDRAATAAGPNGYLPLMLDRLARHYPADVLDDVQELLMLPRPRARHEAFERVDLMKVEEPGLRDLLLWARATPAHALTLEAAARRQNVSARTLARWVQKHIGTSAGEWLRLVKLSQAAEALRSTSDPVKRISDQLGFATEASLYRAFRAATHTTPAAYRQAHGVGPGR